MKVQTEDPVLNRCQDHTINKNKIAIAPTYTIIKINPTNSIFKENKIPAIFKAIKINDKTKSKDHIYRCGIHLIINWDNKRNLIKIFFNR